MAAGRGVQGGAARDAEAEARAALDAETTRTILRAEQMLREMSWEAEAAKGLPEGWSAVESRHPTRPKRASLTIRLDADVAALWRAQGRGYQARINAVLRLYMTAKANGRI